MTVHRKLKAHEQKLLKKTNFLKYREESKTNEDKVVRNYYLQNREDYKKYNKLTGEVTSLVHHLRYLGTGSKVRMQVTQQLLDKLYNMGVIPQRGMRAGKKITTGNQQQQQQQHTHTQTPSTVLSVCRQRRSASAGYPCFSSR